MAKKVAMIVSWNGELVEEGEVLISAFDPMLLRGQGVFETIRVVEGEPRFWEEHYNRFRRSGDSIFPDAPLRDELETQLRKVVEANGLKNARVRITFGTNLLITAEPLDDDVPTVSAATAENYPVNERSPLAKIKCTSYAENMRILWQFGVGEVIRPNTRGELCEGCISNVFFVRDGRIHTPSLETGCLPGVMRTQLIRRNKIEEGTWPLEVLLDADEIWLSNAIRRLRCVVTLDGRKMPPASDLFWEIRNKIP